MIFPDLYITDGFFPINLCRQMDRESYWLCLSELSGQAWEGTSVAFPSYWDTISKYRLMDIDID